MRRLRRSAPRLLDWAVVAVLLPLVTAELAGRDAFADHRALAVACGIGFVLPFAFWRRHPLGVLLVAWGFCALGSVAAASFFLLESPFPLVLYSAYIAGRVPGLRGSLAGLATTIAGFSVVTITSPDPIVGDFLFPGGFVLAMWAGSRTIRNRSLLAAELHEAAARAADRREEAAARAVVEERRRIAREMHDLVGHSISVMVVQAGGARRILDRDADRAVEAAVRVEATGREALAEMRRLLGLLGGDADGEAALEPQPTLDALDPLLDRARAAGLPVTLAVEGERRALPAGAEVAVYRVVQEALTNAIKHAASAATTVRLAWGEDALAVEVADAGGGRTAATPLPSGGHGIVGMRERVRVYGGELLAEPARGGGFVVRASIPYAQGELAAA